MRGEIYMSPIGIVEGRIFTFGVPLALAPGNFVETLGPETLGPGLVFCILGFLFSPCERLDCLSNVAYPLNGKLQRSTRTRRSA